MTEKVHSELNVNTDTKLGDNVEVSPYIIVRVRPPSTSDKKNGMNHTVIDVERKVKDKPFASGSSENELEEDETIHLLDPSFFYIERTLLKRTERTNNTLKKRKEENNKIDLEVLQRKRPFWQMSFAFDRCYADHLYYNKDFDILHQFESELEAKPDSMPNTSQKTKNNEHIFSIKGMTYPDTTIKAKNDMQQKIFTDVGKRILDMTWKGINTILMAYGQTGSGKTYTMFGKGTFLMEEYDSKGYLMKGNTNENKNKDKINKQLSFSDSVLFSDIDSESELTEEPILENEEGLIPRICTSLLHSINSKNIEENRKLELKQSGSSQLDLQELTSPTIHKFELKASYMEIYQEQAFDLLNQGKRMPLKVRENPISGAYVDGLQEFTINSLSDISKIICTGNATRVMASTSMNARSSRSHTIFCLRLTQFTERKFKENISDQKNEDEALDEKSNIKELTSLSSRMHLVDLAGSERVVETGAFGNRMKEANAINKSLSTLGEVINCLIKNHDAKLKRKKKVLEKMGQTSSQNSLLVHQSSGNKALRNLPRPVSSSGLKPSLYNSTSSIAQYYTVDSLSFQEDQKSTTNVGGYIPYRNSLLTWILKDAIGGNCRTMFLATLSPADIHYKESVSTLKYVERLRHAKFNKIYVNETRKCERLNDGSTRKEDNLSQEKNRLQEEISSLRLKLSHYDRKYQECTPSGGLVAPGTENQNQSNDLTIATRETMISSSNDTSSFGVQNEEVDSSDHEALHHNAALVKSHVKHPLYYLLNLNQDPYFSESVKYSIPVKHMVILGSNPLYCDIAIRGQDIEERHCAIVCLSFCRPASKTVMDTNDAFSCDTSCEKYALRIVPFNDTKCIVHVNGKRVRTFSNNHNFVENRLIDCGAPLFHLDRVALGRFHLFRFHDENRQKALEKDRIGEKQESTEGFGWFKAYEELMEGFKYNKHEAAN